MSEADWVIVLDLQAYLLLHMMYWVNATVAEVSLLYNMIKLYKQDS